MSDEDELPPPTPRNPTFLIHDHYRQMGCYSWDRIRFLRLAAAGRWTPEELGKRCGLTPSETRKCLERSGFPDASGILLTFHERYVRHLLTGYDDGKELCPPKFT
jgi:hypothetical protein